MITKISLKDIKCFSDQEFFLKPLNILTGINGVGKSTVIQSILLIAQSENCNRVEMNGALVEIGEFIDLLHENSEDGFIRLELETTEGKSSWGAAESIDHIETVSVLPLIEGNGVSLDHVKKNLIYISAERWGPRSNVPINSFSPNPYWLGKHAEFTIQFLSKLSTGEIKDDDGSLETTLIEGDARLHPSDVGLLKLNNIIAWMGEVSPNVNIDARVIREALIGYSSFGFGGSRRYKAINVGFGLSYSLGIVCSLVAAQKGAILILENPEAHLHPNGQSKLGQLMALATKAGVQVIVETHSEHVVNGARIIVRKGLIEHDTVSIMYVSRDDALQKSQVEVLEVNNVGQVSNWPEGFFDQQAIDMKTLITGR